MEHKTARLLIHDALAPAISKETLEYHYGQTSSDLCHKPEYLSRKRIRNASLEESS